MIDELQEAIEEIGGVVRSSARFGVELHGESRSVVVVDSLTGTVVAVDEAQRRNLRQRIRADGVAVILACDGHAPRPEVLDRLIRTAVAEGQFFC